MNLQERIEILANLGDYISNCLLKKENPEWEAVLHKAYSRNPWFTPESIEHAARAISEGFLRPELLKQWAKKYPIQQNGSIKNIGIVMAGNIPMVGFYDLLCVFISGQRAICKLSSKDDILLKHLVEVMAASQPEINQYILFAERLKDCDAYIATGSNNSARYFDYYFGKFPSIIRKNRTSVAVLNGREDKEELRSLADDIMLYFGLGCRNVTQIFVPKDYDFLPLLEALKSYSTHFDHPKYKNNFDYQLTIYIMNNMYYMTNGSIVLIENEQPFSPIGTLHYSFYEDENSVYHTFHEHPDIQTIIGKKGLAFGKSQQPGLMDYADGVDVMDFLNRLH